MSMLDSVRMALRVSTTAYDDELTDLINAAKSDLHSIGVSTDESKPLVAQAIKLYCRLYFGQPDDFNRIRRAYDELRGQLQISSEYQRGETNDEAG